jgi:hypothetical protein
MNYKNSFLTLFSIVALLILTEAFFGMVFYIKDVREITIDASYVTDEPYLYYRLEHDFADDYQKKYAAASADSSVFTAVLVGGSVADFLGQSGYLQKELSDMFPDKKVMLFNAAVPGYVIEQTFLTIQLDLAKYKPDLIINISGYNDLMSYKLNRYRTAKYPLPPQNYRDFKVIESGKQKNTFASRFSGLFRNTGRALTFAFNFISGRSSYDYTHITDDDYYKVSGVYCQIIQDSYDLCKARGISFVHLLQPVRFYHPDSTAFKASPEAIPQLTNMYNEFRVRSEAFEYSFDITRLFANTHHVYLDDCHLTDEGNQMLAKEICKTAGSAFSSAFNNRASTQE